MSRQIRRFTALALASALLLAGCSAPVDDVAPASVTGGLTKSEVPEMRLADGVIPTIAELGDFVDMIVTDADRKWSSYFTLLSWSKTAPEIDERFILATDEASICALSAPANKQLVVTSHTLNAWYCPSDYSRQTLQVNKMPMGTILLPSETLQDIWRGKILGLDLARPGDFGVAVVVTHEFGHHIAGELREQYYLSKNVWLAEPEGKNVELIADCFSGAWAFAADADQMLEDGDIEEGLAVLDALGSLEEDFSEFPHGTKKERTGAFLLGYGGNDQFGPGKPAACINAFWPVADAVFWNVEVPLDQN